MPVSPFRSSPSAAFELPLGVEPYPNAYQSMSAGPSTPGTVTSQFTAGSSSSRDSSASSPVTPSSIHSALSHATGRAQPRGANGGSLVHRQPLRSHSHSSSTEGSLSGGGGGGGSGSRRKKRLSNGGDDSDGDGELDADLLGNVAE